MTIEDDGYRQELALFGACRVCGGSGRELVPVPDEPHMIDVRVCRACHGSGCEPEE